MEKWVLRYRFLDIWTTLQQPLLEDALLPMKKPVVWSGRPETFVKRAGFVLMACLAVHDKKGMIGLSSVLPIMVREAADDRNFVKKAVNWALRQIGNATSSLIT